MKKFLAALLSLVIIASLTVSGTVYGHEIIGSTNVQEVTTASIFTAAVASDRSRQIANSLKQRLSDVSIEMSYLFAEQTLTNTSNTYKFDFRIAGGQANTSTKPNQLLLDQSDIFIVTQLGMFNYEKITATPEYIRGGLQTNINPLYYTTGVGFTKDHLNQIYAGQIKFHVGNIDAFSNLDTGLFRFGHQLQGDLTNNIYQGRNGDSDGYVTLPEIMILNGSYDAYIQLSYQLFTGIAIANVGGLENSVVFKPQGILVRGGADQKYQQTIIDVVRGID